MDPLTVNRTVKQVPHGMPRALTVSDRQNRIGVDRGRKSQTIVPPRRWYQKLSNMISARMEPARYLLPHP